MGNQEGVESPRPELSTAGFEDAVVKGLVWVCYRRELTRPQAVERCRVLRLDRATPDYIRAAYSEFDGVEPKGDWSQLVN